MTDLFLSSKDKLYEFIKRKQYVRTSEIIRFGVDNFSNRADRNARQLAKEGKIRRMNPDKQKHLFGELKEKVWVIVDWHNNFKINILIFPLCTTLASILSLLWQAWYRAVGAPSSCGSEPLACI